MQTVSRRGFLVLGGTGAAGAVLAACGSTDDPRAEGRDPELLGAALAGEMALQAAYDGLVLGAEGAAAQREFEAAQDRRIRELESLGAAAPADEPADDEPAGGDADGIDATVTAANATIAAYREGSGLLSTEDLRRTATAYLAQVAAELATARAILNQDPAPAAFVTGGSEAPFESPEDQTSDSDETTTTSETTTTEEGQ